MINSIEQDIPADEVHDLFVRHLVLAKLLTNDAAKYGSEAAAFTIARILVGSD
jgi:hypothetical protein